MMMVNVSDRSQLVEASDASKLRDLELMNAKLKRLLAEAHLDIHALKSIFGVRHKPHRPSLKPFAR